MTSKPSLVDLTKALERGDMTPEQAVELGNHVVASGKKKFKPQSREAQMEQLKRDRALRVRAQSKSLPFINEDAFEDFKLVQGLYLIGGQSGKGKSTTAANILATYADAMPKKKAYVITNEELSDAVLGRIACIQTGKNYNSYHKGKLTQMEENEIEDQMSILLDYVYVINDPAYNMSCLEDVQAVMQFAKDEGDVGMVLLDYYQTVEFSREHEDWESFKVLKVLGSYLKEYGRTVDVPVVAFAQLKPKSEMSDMQSRIQNDRTVYNAAFAVIEVVADFETQTTTFVIHKDRFGEVQGREVMMRYDKGRFVPIGGGHL